MNSHVCTKNNFEQENKKVGTNVGRVSIGANLLVGCLLSSYGGTTPNLQKFAIKVLSLTCRASNFERN